MDSTTKMVNAVSMESLDNRSLDNCSTISSLEPHSQVRTLFVSGLPLDCKPRELYLLFRACNGYESSLLKVTNKNGKLSSPVGFVTFVTRQDADEACRILQGVKFDPENSSQTIRLELARSTTKVSKPKHPSPPIISPANLPTIIPNQNLHAALAATAPTLLSQAQPTDIHNVIDQFPYLNDQSQLFGLSLAQALQCSAATASQLIVPNSLATAAMAHIQQQQHLNNLINAAVASVPNAGVVPPPPQSISGNPPCSTLFVANLGANVNEEEVRQLFKSQPGFSRLRMHHKGSSSSVAFVEYQSIPHATMVFLNLQGFQLTNGSNIRIEYAKAKMGGESNNNNGTSAAPGIKTSV